MSVAVYTADYGQFDDRHGQAVPVTRFTEHTRPSEFPDPRAAARFWKCHPHLAAPRADVTVWIDASITVPSPDLPDRALDAMGDADAAFVRHPWRDCIYDEVEIAAPLAKYAGQPLRDQVEHYRAAGHPEHWGLFATGVLVRRTNARTVALGEAWWAETLRWGYMDQLSLPPLLRAFGLRFVTLPASVIWGPDEWFVLHHHRIAA